MSIQDAFNELMAERYGYRNANELIDAVPEDKRLPNWANLPRQNKINHAFVIISGFDSVEDFLIAKGSQDDPSKILNREHRIKQAENPRFEEFDKEYKHVHDWRNYVSEEVRKVWFSLPLIARLAVIDCCEEVADKENWD